MKLRIKGNSIRLRLTQSEVAGFSETGQVTETTEFAVGQLTYALVASEKANVVSANFSDGRITIVVPQAIADDWTQTETVGISAEQSLFENKSLRISVEKDFVCSSEREGEDESDNFPHPTGKC